MLDAPPPENRIVRGGVDPDLLLSLPRPVLQIILGLLENRPVDLPPSRANPNRLLPFRLVCKGLRAAVDERLSFLTCRLTDKARDGEPPKPKHQHGGEYMSLFSLGLARWRNLTYLVLTNVDGNCDFLEFAFCLLPSGCPNLQHLSIRHQFSDPPQTGVGIKRPGVLCLRELRHLRHLSKLSIQTRQLSLDGTSTLAALKDLKLYDVMGLFELRGRLVLDSLVLERDEWEEDEEYDFEEEEEDVNLVLHEMTIKSVAIYSHRLERLTLPASLTSLTLFDMAIQALGSPPIAPIELPNLLELELDNIIIPGECIIFEIPTGLTKLTLSCGSPICHLPVVPQPVDILPRITKLRELCLVGRVDIQSLPDIRGLVELVSVRLVDLKTLTCIRALRDVSSLERLEVMSCPVSCLPPLDDFKALSTLTLAKLASLIEPVYLGGLTSLVKLDLDNVKHSPLGDDLLQLRHIQYWPCDGVKSLRLPSCHNLLKVTIYHDKKSFVVHGQRQALVQRFLV